MLTTTIPVIVIATIMTFTGIPAVNASPDLSTLATTNWGNNNDGWHLIVHNDTDSTFIFTSNQSNGVYDAPLLSPHTTNTTIRGKDLFGKPDRMFVVYKIEPTQKTNWSRFVEIRGGSSGNAKVRCGMHHQNGLINEISNLTGCEVLSTDSHKPIKVRFYDTQDSPGTNNSSLRP
jgi:hypothetical protein